MPMNTTHYVTLGGQPAEMHPSFAQMVKPAPGTAAAAKINDILWDSETLVQWQRHVFRLGFQGAVLGDNIYGWCVRNDSGLANWARMSPNFESMFEAIKWGIAWAKGDPIRREFYAHKHDLTQKPVIIKRR